MSLVATADSLTRWAFFVFSREMQSDWYGTYLGAGQVIVLGPGASRDVVLSLSLGERPLFIPVGRYELKAGAGDTLSAGRELVVVP
ncbi:hypothetical protein [Gemmatimonas sp.]|uniref:hypothetical protein n=1 Tax=Gemmatimonas sp. TaxID=1962908 RepID=UPI0039833397